MLGFGTPCLGTPCLGYAKAWEVGTLAGIRKFAADAVKLEALVQAKLDAAKNGH